MMVVKTSRVEDKTIEEIVVKMCVGVFNMWILTSV